MGNHNRNAPKHNSCLGCFRRVSSRVLCHGHGNTRKPSPRVVDTVFSDHALPLHLIWNEIVAEMVLEAATQPEFFTATSAYSLAAVAMIGFTASTAANAFLSENARWQDRATFVWLVGLNIFFVCLS